MNERKRFTILCLLVVASIVLFIVVTNDIDQSFVNQFSAR